MCKADAQGREELIPQASNSIHITHKCSWDPFSPLPWEQNSSADQALVHVRLQEAIAAWPTLQASGLRLGSPATSIAQDGTQSGSWIGQFMQQVPCLLWKLSLPLDSAAHVMRWRRSMAMAVRA